MSQVEATHPRRPLKRVFSRPPPPIAKNGSGEEVEKTEAPQPPVLRFYGLWRDDKGGCANAEERRFRVHYHTEDDTIEVLESHDTNCGRYKAPLFIKRTRLPKVKR